MHGNDLTERITRSLAYMLRHQPDEFDLELDRQGFADIGDVVCALNERLAEPIEEDDVAEALDASDRARYELVEGRIRALYGHSIPIDLGEPDEPPDFLWVGVGSRDAARAEDDGLRAGRRTYLHLALTEEEARESGRRISVEYAVVKVHAGDAWEEGIDFHDRKSLWLSEAVPAEFLEVGEMQTDGIERERRGRGRRDDRDRGPRRGRRDDRPRREERDDRPRREERDERPRREERDERPRREEREEAVSIEPTPPPMTETRPAARPEPAREAVATSGGGDEVGGFGGGIFEQKSAPRPERPVASEETPPPAPAPAPAPEPAPEPEPVVEPDPPAGGGFGAGL